MTVTEDRFSFFAPAYLIKSKNDSSTGMKSYKVGGCISSEVKDTDGETLLSKGLDTSYLFGGWGKLKYEHDNGINKEPDNIWGAPQRAIKKGTELHFEGETFPFDESLPDNLLTPQQRTAKSAIGLLKSIDEYNALHPDNPMKVGWSIEGAYLERDKRNPSIVTKARITNVVLTTKPVNTTTFAMLIKSLSVGHDPNPVTMTGFAATQKEDLDKNIKYQSNLNKKESKMFRTKDECYFFHKGQGKSDEDATKAADTWEQAQKSVAGEKLNKAIATLNEAASIVVDLKITDLKKSFNNVIQKSATDGKDEINLTEYFDVKTQSDLQLLQAQDAIVNKVNILTKGLIEAMEGFNIIAKSVDQITELSRLNAQANVKMLKSKAGEGIIPSELIQKLQIEENNDMNKAVANNLTKSQKVTILDKLAEKGEIAPEIVMNYEGGAELTPDLENLIKSNVDLLKK